MPPIEFINPGDLPSNPAFSQIAVASSPGRTVWIGGQNAVNSGGSIIGEGDIVTQTDQVLRNIESALAAADASLDNLVKCTIYIVQGQSIETSFEAAMRRWGGRNNPPTITVLVVAGLSRPEYLIEMDAVAFVSD